MNESWRHFQSLVREYRNGRITRLLFVTLWKSEQKKLRAGTGRERPFRRLPPDGDGR